MSRFHFVAVLCLAALACQARADPIVAEIKELVERLFDQPSSNDHLGASEANQTLEELIRLESLVEQRADQYDQLLADVRELISFSQITDEKCQAGRSIGVMLGNHIAYYDISRVIQNYWSYQATRQLEHCLVKINEALAEQDDSGRFINLMETIRTVSNRMALFDHEDYIKGTLVRLNTGKGGALPITESKFNGLWEDNVLKACDDALPAIEPWIQIFYLHDSVFLNGVFMEYESTDRINLIKEGFKYCHEITFLKDKVLKLYIPDGARGILNQALLGNYKKAGAALYEALTKNNDE